MTSQSGDTNLTETTDTTLTIPTLASGSYSSPSDFPANHWGYKKDSGNYIPFAINTTILESDTYANDDTTTLSFATKIDYLQASGTYKTTLVFTTTANPLVTYIQNLDSSLCTEEPLTVVDNRDNQEYVVQRLADGNCWMMTNLNLGAVELTTDLTSENTNLATTITSTTFNSWKKTAGTGTRVAGEYIPVSGTDSTSKTPYGTLYNYCATSANTYCMASSTGGSAEYDICPAGWRLPTAGSTGDFQKLYSQSAYNTYAKMRSPYTSGGAAFNLSGSFSTTPAVSVGTYGYFWSSTFYNTTRYGLMSGLWLENTSVKTSDWSDRSAGRSIRCIAK